MTETGVEPVGADRVLEQGIDDVLQLARDTIDVAATLAARRRPVPSPPRGPTPLIVSGERSRRRESTVVVNSVDAIQVEVS